MQKTASQKISIFLSGFILLAWAACMPASICGAAMQELTDNQLADVHGAGFSTFSLENDLLTGNSIARISFNNVTTSTWTEIASMKMGYHSGGWDNDWTNASLGTSATDLVGQGLTIEAKFSTDSVTGKRQLDHLRIGTPNMTGAVSANFNSFSGSIGGTTYTRTNLGTTTITSSGTGFYLSLERSGSQMGYSFHWANATVP